jgi:uncharacterized protein YpmS
MTDKKQRLFRLIENYINDFQGESVQKIYGEGSKIKVHAMTESFSTNFLLFEVVVMLGETINESVMDDSLANVLIQDSLVYFFPEHQIKTYVRFDV